MNERTVIIFHSMCIFTCKFERDLSGAFQKFACLFALCSLHFVRDDTITDFFLCCWLSGELMKVCSSSIFNEVCIRCLQSFGETLLRSSRPHIPLMYCWLTLEINRKMPANELYSIATPFSFISKVMTIKLLARIERNIELRNSMRDKTWSKIA